MHIFVGTSGYSYKEWKGNFYPEKLPQKDMLGYYGERLSAVEINNTFYRMPKASVLESWADQVPDGFRFVLKASQRITHKKRLKDAGDETDYLLRTASVLKERLGPVLFQLPPYLKIDVPRLKAFLDLIPEGAKAAFEFRHESWFDEEVLAALRAKSCALCVADVDDDAPDELSATAPWGYLRLRRVSYSDADLSQWLERIRSQNWQEAYVFFKHEDDCAGPQLATRFLESTKSNSGA